MSRITEEIQKLHADSPLVELFQLDLRALGGERIYFTNTLGRGEIYFDGIKYHTIPVTTEGWEISSSGTMPQPNIQISNVNAFLLSEVINMGDLAGAALYRTLTFFKFLDGQPDADASMIIGRPQKFYVKNIQSQDDSQITWGLITPLEMQTRVGRQVLRRGTGDQYFPGAGKSYA